MFEGGVDADIVSKSADVYTARKEFFWSRGYTAQKFADAIKVAIDKSFGPDAFQLVDKREIWKAFNGGGNATKNSHWMVKFKLNSTLNPAVKK